MVVEAKRVEATFELSIPAPKGSGLLRPVQTLLNRGGTQLREVLEQAAGYCNARGVPLACATNGYQWLFFRGLSAPKRSWTKGVAIVFQSADEVIADFDVFLGCIGRAWAGTSFLPQRLDRPATEPSRPPTIPRDLFRGRRPDIDSDGLSAFRAVTEFLFTEIYGEDRREMLERCYVQPGLTAEFEKNLQRLLKDSAKPFEDEVEVETLVEGGTSRFVKEVVRQEQIGFREPVLVVGHVGAGKTTFLQRALSEFRARHDAFCVLVDLEGRGQGGVLDAVAEETWVSDAIIRKLGTSAATVLRHNKLPATEVEQADPDSRDTLRTMCRERLAAERQLGRAVWDADPSAWDRKEYEIISVFRSNTRELIVSFVRHLRGRFRRDDHLKYPILIVLDNLDLADSDYQRCIYGLARRIARETPAIVVISIREDTFREAIAPGGFLTSSPLPFVFHVASPPLDHVIRSRVKFATTAAADGVLPRGLRTNTAAIEQVCSSLERTLLVNRSDALLLFAGLAGHNTREGLGLVRAMVQGSLNAKMKEDASVAFAFECILGVWGHKGLKARGIGNCLDAAPAVPPSHALRTRLLAYYSWAATANSERVGLETTESVLGRFGAWGYPVAIVAESLRQLLAAGLLRSGSWQESSAESHESGELPIRLSLTPAGYVHLTKLVELRAYRAAMACVTHWYDPELVKRFVEHCQRAGGEGGPTIADIGESGAVEIFDAYLMQMTSLENAQLASGVGQQIWVREVNARAGRVLGGSPAEGTRVDKSSTSAQSEIALPSGAKATLRMLSKDVEYAGTLWVPRILWALEWARLNGTVPLSASGIARVLVKYGDVDVPNTNVARAFRELKDNDAVQSLWKVEGKRYSITDAGSVLIRAILSDDDASLGGRA
jgi:hypothetical protein